jgi:hypothetical protein
MAASKRARFQSGVFVVSEQHRDLKTTQKYVRLALRRAGNLLDLKPDLA